MANRFIPPRAVEPVAAEGGAASAVAASASVATYEFSEVQNHVFRSLGSVIKFVAIVSVLYGVLQVVLAFGIGMNLTGILTAGQGAALIAIGLWLASAAGGFKDIATSQGSDISHLMYALEKLRSVYTLQAWLLGITCALVGVVIVIGLAR